MKNKVSTLIELLVVMVIIIIIVVVFIFIGLFIIGGGTPNSGQHTGIITSVEQEGIIWKTWKAYVKTSAQSTQEDTYCVTNPDVVNQLQTFAASTTGVTVKYSRGFFVWPWQCGGESSIINSVTK